MNLTLTVVILALLVGLLFFVYLSLKNIREVKQLRRMSTHVSEATTSEEAVEDVIERVDFSIRNESGEAVLDCFEISRFPKKAIEIDSGSDLAKRSTHLISDVFKGSIGIPNKTVELVFKPEIAKGLKDGSYVLMQTKNGETLADAVDATGKQVVGKGRVVQGGKLKQLSVGAYNLLSIAVAQSHLASIESSLSDIKGQLKDIKDKLNSNDYSELKGAIDYYTTIKEKIACNESPSELAETLATNIESINKDSNVWRSKVFRDFEDLTSSIKSLKDLDTFGTEKTYLSLMGFVKQVERISERYALLLQLSLISKAVLYYIDPSSKKFTSIEVEVENWHKLVSDFESAIQRKAKSLFSKAVFNEDSTLENRRNNLILQSKIYRLELVESVKCFTENYARIESNMNSMFDSGELKFVLEFDKQGEVSRTALIP